MFSLVVSIYKPESRVTKKEILGIWFQQYLEYFNQYTCIYNKGNIIQV